MRLRFLFFNLIITLITFCFAAANQENRFFYDAVRAEASGDLDLAISLYLEASNFAHSSNLHGNLANLYFKKEQFGHSILHFRKALLLNPRNKELSANLNFAYEMAKVQPDPKDLSNTFFSADLLSLWLVLTAFIFWSGILLLIYLFFFIRKKKVLAYTFTGWLFIFILSIKATQFSFDQRSYLEREVIAHFSTNDNNYTDNIPLRRFAGETNSANTNILPGESLIIQTGQDGVNKAYRLPNGELWYLAESTDGLKKGWIKDDEISWILDPI